MVVLGTRPEATKMAPVIQALEAAPGLSCRLVSTGQHKELLDSALDDLGVSADLDLGLMSPDQQAADLVAAVLAGVAGAIRSRRPAMVLVHGDTGSACGAAMASFLERIPLGHVEAGLRSGSLSAPFPEEGNRRVIDTLSDILWAPTQEAAARLAEEGLSGRRIEVTGNTAIDSLMGNIGRARIAGGPSLPGVPQEARIILVTMHRREAFGAPLRQLCDGIRKLVDTAEDLHVVYPVHLNPNVRRPVRERLEAHPRIHLLDPLPYLSFLALMDRSILVLTDSGGLQEEAPALGKPVLVMRDRTERQEAVRAGTVQLVGTSAVRLVDSARRLLEDAEVYQLMASAQNPYGDGQAAARIISSIQEYFSVRAD